MESTDKWNRDFLALRLLDKRLHSKNNGRTGMIARHLLNTFKIHGSLQPAGTRSECVTGSCPNLTMSRHEQLEQLEQRPAPVTLTPQLTPRAHRPLCLSVSSDHVTAPKTQESRSSLKAQMELASSAGASSSTGSLERASLFCGSGSSSGLSSPMEPLPLAKTKSSSRFSLFSPPWSSSSESDSNPPSRSGSGKRRGDRGGRLAAEETAESGRASAEPFRHSQPAISKVTDHIYVGNLDAAYSGRALCRNGIDSVVDVSGPRDERSLRLVPCTCSLHGAWHAWSRLKVDLWDPEPGPECRHFEDINECIAASAEKRKRVLVHCRDGYSLAPTCVIQYLMVRRDMTLMAAYELVRARHPVNITESHRDLLIGLERALRPAAAMDPESFKQAISRRVAWT